MPGTCDDVIQGTLSGELVFRVVPYACGRPLSTGEVLPPIVARALFSFDGDDDDALPLPGAGLTFTAGDLLEIVNRTDASWWQVGVM